MPDHSPIPNWLKRFLPSGEAPATPWQRAIAYCYRLTTHGTRELRQDKAGQMAAALTFHTLFSLLPMLALAMVVINSLASEVDRTRFVHTVVEMVVPQTDVAAATPGEAAALAEKRESLKAVRNQIAGTVERFLSNVQTHVNFGGVGIIGLLVFIYGATALLATIERSFNDIFGVPHQRPWYLRLPMYYTTITLGPVLLIAGQAVQGEMLNLIKGERLTAWLAGPVLVLSPVVSTWLLLFALYALLPNTKVNKRAAAIGAFVAAVMYVVTQELFALYVRNAGVTTFYGALALLPLFLMWLYYGWLIVLFGGELTHVLSAMKAGGLKHMQRQADERLIDAAWVLPIAATIAEAFGEGHSVDAGKLAQTLSLPPRAVRELLESLEKSNVIHRVDEEQGVAFALARPAERIPLQQVIEAGRRLLPAEPTEDKSPAWTLVHRMHSVEQASGDRRTLADICRNGKDVNGCSKPGT